MLSRSTKDKPGNQKNNLHSLVFTSKRKSKRNNQRENKVKKITQEQSMLYSGELRTGVVTVMISGLIFILLNDIYPYLDRNKR